MTSAGKEVSSRVRVRRGPKKGRYDRTSIDAVLDRGLVAHVAFADGDGAGCIPMLYARVGDEPCDATAGGGGARVRHGHARARARACALGLRALGELRLGAGVRRVLARRGRGGAAERLRGVHGEAAARTLG